MEYELGDNTINLYFLSHKEGTEIPEGSRIQNIEPTMPILRYIQTIDANKVRDARDRLFCKFTFKLNQSANGMFNLIEMIEPDWQEFEKEIGLRCDKCNQSEEHTGEYPCEKCGRPTVWDNQEWGL